MRSHAPILVFTAPVFLFAFTACAQMYDEDSQGGFLSKDTVFQVMVGASFLDEDEMTFEQSSSSDPTVSSEADLSTLPVFGVACQHPLIPEPSRSCTISCFRRAAT